MPLDFGGATAYGTAIQPWVAGQQGAAFGLEQGQKQASINALQGVNLDDPASVDAGIKNSIRAANLEQASALLGLNAKRAVFSGLPSFLASFGQSGAPSQAAPNALAPQGAPAPTSAPVAATGIPDGAGAPAPTSATPDQVAQHRQIMTEARGAVTQLQNTPPEQRAQVADGIKQQFLNHGVPEPAVDSALSDLSDEGLAKTGQYYDGVLAASAPQTEGQQAPAMPDHPTQFGWATNLLQDPQKLALLNYYKAAGIDLTGVIDAAEKVAGPQIQAQADIAKAGPIAEAGKAAELKYAPALAGVDIAKEGGIKGVDLSYAGPIAAATAAGTVAGQAPGKIQEINLPGGGTLQGTFTPGADGTYVFHPVQSEGGAGGGSGNAGGGAPGQSQTPGQKTQQEHQAAQAAEFLKPDEKATTTANSSIAAAQRLLSLADQISLNPATEFAGKVANVGRAVGWPGADKYATDVAAMESALKQGNLEALHQAFPARITNSDLQFGSHAYGGLSTPNDQVRFIAGMQLAAAQRQLDYENFKANYNGPKDNPQQIQQAWLRGEGGQSLFTMPTWSNVKLGGRQAFNPATDIKSVTENGRTERVARFGGNGSAPIYITLH